MCRTLNCEGENENVSCCDDSTEVGLLSHTLITGGEVVEIVLLQVEIVVEGGRRCVNERERY